MNDMAVPHGRTDLRIETRSIEAVPHHERHGAAWHLGPFWFTGNFVLTTLTVGFIGPALGLGVLHSIIALLVGVAIGSACMALHANQGPRLGLSQMIQSRAQFGQLGAVLPMLVAVCVYLGLNVFNLVLATDAITRVLPGPDAVWFALIIGVAMLMAVAGHDLLIKVQRSLTYLLVGVFAVLTIAALLLLEPDTVQRSRSFYWPAFFVQLSAAAGYQISYAVYGSDYSRYLPRNTPARSVMLWSYAGAAVSAVWLMSLGALLASAVHAPDAVASLQQLGNRFLPGFGTFVVIVAVPALIGIIAINCYGAMLTGLGVVSTFRPVRAGIGPRVVGVALAGAVVYLVALRLPLGYQDSFTSFLMLMLYCLMPWSAINLTGFYLLRERKRGNGDWGWPGLLAYAGGIVAMLPFLSLGHYQGWMVEVLEGADIAFVIGFGVSALLYAGLARRC
ncbi:purine-cytosine permease family protein [Pseudomonas fontis]|uniref:Cytosine permease n=1 Tax=Pseudomonas fontis TaxID=2942633 RepID=A0ABT5NS71_9PSED|nr:cytosine permease [Pseudomonas fontis]MDD0973716.1 cytosine permease [Pseudomonas fontis]MDD0991013.1 cytosine permease [Pseudomonas fontis]